MDSNKSKKIVILGTGGTIAGRAASAGDNIGYTAAQVGVADLLAAMPAALAGSQATLVAEQVAQVDSKDMEPGVWQRLAARAAHHLAQADVAGLVVTHGTDTLEETAYFLHRVLPADKPVVLTCAMRPASSASPDGPQNLSDAVVLAATPGARGVLVVCAGVVHEALAVQKVHTYRLSAFDSGDAGPLGFIEESSLRLAKNWPPASANASHDAIKLRALVQAVKPGDWPRVEILLSHAGASGLLVDALLAAHEKAVAAGAGPGRLGGLVVAGTGNGTLHQALEAALLRAQAAGILVLRSTRCAYGRVLPRPDDALADSQGLSPVKARVALQLELLAR